MLLLSLLCSACASNPEPAPPKSAGTSAALTEPDTPVVVGLVGAPGKLAPYGDSLGSAVLSRLVLSGLLRIGHDGVLTPELAESWQVSEDRRTYTISLRKDARWHDGTLVDVDDVLFTLSTLTDPACPLADSEKWAGRSVKRSGDAVVISLPQPDDSLLFDLVAPIVPRKVFQGRKPADWWYQSGREQEAALGAGPFSLVSMDRVGGITTMHLSRSDSWPGGKARVSRLQVRFYATRAELLAAVENGSVHLAKFPDTMRETQVKNPDYTVASVPRDGFVALAFNNGRRRGAVSPFADVSLRKAVAILARKAVLDLSDPRIMPFDSADLIDSTVAHQPGLDSSKQSLSEETSLQQAASVMEGGGWQHSAGKWRRGKHTASFELVIPAYDPIRVKIGRHLAEQLKGFGFGVTVTEDEAQVFGIRANPPFDYDAILLGWSLSNGSDIAELLHSRSIPKLDTSIIKVVGGHNIMQYRSAEMDAALEAYRPICPAEERKAAAQQIKRILTNDLPFVSLYAHREILVTHRLLNTGSGRMHDLFSSAQEWSLASKTVTK